MGSYAILLPPHGASRPSGVNAMSQIAKVLWGASCTDSDSIRKECFTSQSCGQFGKSRRVEGIDSGGRIITLVAFVGGKTAGLLQSQRDTRKGRYLIYNVCVLSQFRRRGVATELFAHLAELIRGAEAELTVYLPVAFKGPEAAFAVSVERFPKLLRMYASLGFVIAGVDVPFVRMWTGRLIMQPPESKRAPL